MSRTRYYEEYHDVNLMNLYMEILCKLSQLGALFNDTANYSSLTQYQIQATGWSQEGWCVGDQIHSMYGWMGAILEEIENRQV